MYAVFGYTALRIVALFAIMTIGFGIPVASWWALIILSIILGVVNAKLYTVSNEYMKKNSVEKI